MRNGETYNPAWIQTELRRLGFEVEVNESNLVAFKQIIYEGTIRLAIDLADRSINLQLQERFSTQPLLYHQAFTDDEHLMELLRSNYVFDELIFSRDPGIDPFMDAIVDILWKWTDKDMGDVTPLIDAIKAATSPLFVAHNSATPIR